MVEALQVLRALHILFAVAWMGGGLYAFTVVLGSARMGEAGRRLQAGFYATGRHGPYMGATAVGTVLFGGAVMGMGDYGSDVLGTTGAMVLGLSMTLALAALLLGIFGHVPTTKRLRPLAQQALAGEAPEGYETLVARDHRFSHVSMGLMGFALLGMLTFRFF